MSNNPFYQLGRRVTGDFRHWKKKDRGLGDTVARITGAVGIKPCGGCKKRQEALNRMVPYKKTNSE